VHSVSGNSLEELMGRLEPYNTVIIGLHRSNASPWKSYKFTKEEIGWLHEISRTHNIILDVFVKPYALAELRTMANIETVIVSYQNSAIAQEKSAQLIFGAIPAQGVLPVSIGAFFNAGEGKDIAGIKRLGYTVPERVGVNSEKLNKLDSVANYAISHKMTPGIQLLVARKGKVIYNKNFGKHTYTGRQKVVFDDVYDVASLTKILATLPLLMELEEQNVVTLDTKLVEILPEYKGSNKENITLKQMLSHYARLRPWEPFYYHTLDSVTKRPSQVYYRKTRSPEFNVEVSNNLFLRSDYPDSIQGIIKDSKLLDQLKYRYSDFPYYILKKFIED